jgi:hypothetical protein
MKAYENVKLNYATIILGTMRIEGYCDFWEITGNGTFIKLRIDGVQYLTAHANVLLTEREERKD